MEDTFSNSAGDDAQTERVIGRRFRRRLRQPSETATPAGAGPYETEYDIAHGYPDDRPILQP